MGYWFKIVHAAIGRPKDSFNETYNSLCVSPPLRLCVKIVVMVNAETQRRGDAEGITSH